MRRFKKDELICIMTALMLSACAWTRSLPPTVLVMPESRVMKVEVGTPVPWTGWLLSESAMARLLETAEACSDQAQSKESDKNP